MTPSEPVRRPAAKPALRAAEGHDGLMLAEAGIAYTKAPVSIHTLWTELRKLRTRLGLGQKEMGDLMGISIRKLSGIETGAMTATEDDVRRYNELNRLCAELATLIQPEGIGAWLRTPSEYFDGSSAAQVIERGEIDRVWRLVWRVQDGVPLD